MASQTRSAGLGQSIVYGTRAWTNPINIYTSNNVDAYSSLPLWTLSYWLQATTFGFTIPTGAIINGISVYIERQCNRASAVKDAAVHIVRGGLRLTATNKKKTTFWETADTVTLYGGSTDLWNVTWTPAQINASNFGVATSAENAWYDGSAAAYVDHIYITVYYTVPEWAKINIGDAWKNVTEVKINIGDTWKPVTKIQINIGDVWKTIFG